MRNKFCVIALMTGAALCLTGAVAMGDKIHALDSLEAYRAYTATLDARRDANLNNPEEYEKIMNESVELMESPEYEKIAAEMEAEQENSREHLYAYLADAKCALMDYRQAFNPEIEEEARALEILEQQIAIFEDLEEKAKQCPDDEIGDFSRKVDHITETMEAGETLPDIPDGM